MTVFVIIGHDEDGMWEPEVYKNKEKALEALEEYRIDFKGRYNDPEEILWGSYGKAEIKECDMII